MAHVQMRKEGGTDLLRAEIIIIVPDLKHQSYQICQRQDVVFRRTSILHQPGCQTEQTPCLVRNHKQIFIFGRYGPGITPEQLDALPTVQVQHLFVVDANCFQRVVQMYELLLREKVRVVGGVDALGSAKDAVCRRKSTPQLGAVLNVIDPDIISIPP